MSKYIFNQIIGLKLKTTLLIFLAIITTIVSCKDDDNEIEITQPIDLFADLNLPGIPFDYENIDFPDHYLNNPLPATPYRFQFAAIESDNTPESNPTTNEGALLGRVLFYEKKLSANGTIACASCHKQETGFSDDEKLSIGFKGGKTRRHSMTLTNARFYDTGKFFWDERAETLEDQVLMPFQDEVEMGLTLDTLVQIVASQSYAAPLFKDAFGDETVTSERISMALAQFVRSLVSINAKYDEGRKSVSSPLEDFPNFTAQENAGKALFYSTDLVAPSCQSCHGSEAFLSPLLAPNGTTIAAINGLDAESTDDLGVYETTGVNNHIGKFKVPSLRNVAVRAPYMHDGRFANLEQVIDHYSTGMQNHPRTLPFMKDTNGNAIKYNFTDQEKQALIAFLNTLTDEQFLADEKFSSPFK